LCCRSKINKLIKKPRHSVGAFLFTRSSDHTADQKTIIKPTLRLTVDRELSTILTSPPLPDKIIQDRTEDRQKYNCNDPENFLLSVFVALYDIDNNNDIDNENNKRYKSSHN
jgi:hypothetical protein